jgi:MSHA biogenesis protein MshJ
MIEPLLAQWRKLGDRIDELSLRERALVFLVILGAMYFGAMQFVIQPLIDQRARLSQQLDSRHKQTQAMEQQIQAMLTGEAHGADAAKRARLEALRGQVKNMEAELGRTTSGLVTPKEMARLVERFLAGRHGLEVLKVESLAPESVAQDGRAALIYKHGMRIELRGTYLDMVRYLKGLESLPWKVFWGQVTLESERYPISRLTLVIYTLSTREGWIGI